MLSKKKLTGIILATGAALAFATLPVIANAGSHGMVKCMGVNACKGKSDCKTSNGCKGKNDCKGKGIVMMSKSECEKVGGTEGK